MPGLVKIIITQTPLRISLGGGGTDLASYYKKHGGFLVAGAIDKYVYISLHRTFKPRIIAHYSKHEIVQNVEDLQHPLIREALKLTGVTNSIEITSMADIPAGTGLGSSSSFTVGLLKALHTCKKEHIIAKDLAEEACKIEIDLVKEPIGKQDQYIASFGGITSFTFNKNGSVDVVPLKLSNDTVTELENNLLLFFTNTSRSASAILKEQDDKSKKDDSEMLENLHFVKELGYKSKKALESGNLNEFGELMDVHWQNKKKRSGNMSNKTIDKCYDLALKNGALGGKLVGAGGGGFLMFYTENREKLIKTMEGEGMSNVEFKLDFDGSKVLINQGI